MEYKALKIIKLKSFFIANIKKQGTVKNGSSTLDSKKKN